jgi:DegV family protein with EDD domain
MEFQQLSPQHLLHAIISGCENLKQARQTLNEINFFPVADGDTGDNMAATAAAIIDHSKMEDNIHDTLKSVANASIMGARGNSGMLFSSFFNGLFQGYENHAHLNTQHFSDMLKKAALQVRSSLMNPMEGTLLTVIESWAQLIENKSKEFTSFKTLCDEILKPLRQTLDEKCQYTYKNTEKVLDAGALGFYHFVEGFSKSIGAETPLQFNKTKPIEEFSLLAADHEFASEPPTNRYCTEALLHDTNINPAQLQMKLQEFGDSIVVTGHQHLQRFHVHTNHPEKIFEWLKTIGRIANPKVDDMQRQFECHACAARKPIGILTDSSADLPTAIRDQHQIHLLPINIHIEEHHLLDPYTINHHNFYQGLRKAKHYPTTSAPNPLQIGNKLRELSQKHDHLIMITVAEKLSSTYGSAYNIAQDYQNVHVINSKLTSMAQSLLVHHASIQAQKSDAKIHDVVNSIKQTRQNIVCFVMVNKMDALIRSGRVDKLLGTFANIAQLKPILKLNDEGRGELFDKSISSSRALVSLLKHVEKEQEKRKAKVARFAIVHAGNEEGALQLSELFRNKFYAEPLYVNTVSAAIGLHAGYGCVGVGVLFED